MLTICLAIAASVAQVAAPRTVPTPASEQAPTPEAKPTPDGPVIAIETNLGTIQVGFYATRAPRSTANIMQYVKSGFYTGTTFHRVIPGFMIQGGGLDAKMIEKPVGPPVRNEARNGLSNTRGSLSLARTNDPHSATSQFFINVKDNPALDFGISRDGWGYAVFGEVLFGMDVVDRIVSVPTSSFGPHESVPITPVVINAVRVVSEPPSPAMKKTVSPRPASRLRASPSAAPGARPKATQTPSGY